MLQPNFCCYIKQPHPITTKTTTYPKSTESVPHCKTAFHFSSAIDNPLFYQPEGAGFFSSGQAVGFWMQRRVLKVRKQIHNPTTPLA